MQNAYDKDNGPAVILSIELAPSLNRIAQQDDLLYEAVQAALEQKLDVILKVLGIPGVPIVRLAISEKPLRADRPMQVSINGQMCRYPSELLRWVRSYVLGQPLPPENRADEVLQWISHLCNSASVTAKDTSEEMLAEFFSLACTEIINNRPDILLGIPHVKAYSDLLAEVVDQEANLQPKLWSLDTVWLHRVLSGVLHLKISIGDKRTVAKILLSAEERSPEDVTEDLIVALRPDVLEIHLPEEYLRQLTTSDPKNGLGLFTFLRDGMFEETGLHYPAFRFVVVNYLKPHSFAFKLNHLLMLPCIGLLSNQCLVNDTPERLELITIQAKATSNPATGQIGGIIDLRSKDTAESAGLTTWTPFGYFILTLAAHLRRNGACFVHCQVVQELLDQLKFNYPALVDAVQLKVSLEQVTRTFRALVAEELSIRNLRAILERLLDYTYLVTDSSRGIVLENRLTSYEQLSETRLKHPVNMVSFIRAGLKRLIANKYTKGTNTLVVYLLDEKIEAIVLERISSGQDKEGGIIFDEVECNAILDGLHAELMYLPPTAQVPSILTLTDARPFLHSIIDSEFPRLSVLCYQELPSDLNIQPVARVSVS